MHRSYNDRFDGEAVAIDVFDDRVEITNPAEGNGSGLLLMVNEMKANCLKEPEFYPDRSFQSSS